MGKKSNVREAKKLLAQKKFEANKPVFLARVITTSDPKREATPPLSRVARMASHLAQESGRTPKAIMDGGRFGSRVTWCVSKADQQGMWSWGEYRQWGEYEWNTTIHPSFREFEQLTWQEIDNFSSNGHKTHHGHEAQPYGQKTTAEPVQDAVLSSKIETGCDENLSVYPWAESVLAAIDGESDQPTPVSACRGAPPNPYKMPF